MHTLNQKRTYHFLEGYLKLKMQQKYEQEGKIIESALKKRRRNKHMIFLMRDIEKLREYLDN